MSSRDRVSAWLARAIEAGAFPAASAAVVARDGELLRAEQPSPSSEGRLLYDLASLTKVMATTMICLRLVDRGEITLEDSISRFVPAPPEKAAITILDLLRHTGGFEAHYDLAAETTSEEGQCPFDPLDVILGRPLSYRSGTDVVYSCIGFIVLGRILERAAGERLDVLARRLVFEPLALEATGYLPEGWARATDTVLPTEKDPRTGSYIRAIVHDENARFLGGVSGNAGLFSCLDDCARFARLLLNSCDGFLSSQLSEMMVRNWTPGMRAARGLGVSLIDSTGSWPGGDVLAEGAFGHTGFTGTSLFVSPTHGLAFVLLTNRVNYGRDLAVMPRYRSEFHETALRAAADCGAVAYATQDRTP